jgi:hypothetical protein
MLPSDLRQAQEKGMAGQDTGTVKNLNILPVL